jgi:hypothetical protein
MSKLAVLIPYFGGVDYEHLQCVNALKLLAMKNGDVNFHEHPHCPWIDMAQAYLADRAIEDEEVDILFWIEHDMVFKASDVFLMADRCRQSKYDILGAAYSQRRPKGLVVGEPKEENPEFFVDRMYDATHCGMGFTAMKRRVFEELRKTVNEVYCPAVDHKIHPYFAHIIEDMYLGQDSSFYRRANRAGLNIGIDALPRIFHRGNYNYGLEDTGIQVPRYEKLIMHSSNYSKGD